MAALPIYILCTLQANPLVVLEECIDTISKFCIHNGIDPALIIYVGSTEHPDDRERSHVEGNHSSRNNGMVRSRELGREQGSMLSFHVVYDFEYPDSWEVRLQGLVCTVLVAVNHSC